MTDKSKIATILLAGLAAGAAIYYLMSTEKGKETCDKWVDSLKNVGESLKDLKTKAADTIDQLSGKAADAYSQYSGKAQKFASDAQSRAESV
jgi:gas vesicle protein